MAKASLNLLLSPRAVCASGANSNDPRQFTVPILRCGLKLDGSLGRPLGVRPNLEGDDGAVLRPSAPASLPLGDADRGVKDRAGLVGLVLDPPALTGRYDDKGRAWIIGVAWSIGLLLSVEGDDEIPLAVALFPLAPRTGFARGDALGELDTRLAGEVEASGRRAPGEGGRIMFSSIFTSLRLF